MELESIYVYGGMGNTWKGFNLIILAGENTPRKPMKE